MILFTKTQVLELVLDQGAYDVYYSLKAFMDMRSFIWFRNCFVRPTCSSGMCSRLSSELLFSEDVFFFFCFERTAVVMVHSVSLLLCVDGQWSSEMIACVART